MLAQSSLVKANTVAEHNWDRYNSRCGGKLPEVSRCPHIYSFLLTTPPMMKS